VARLGCGDGEGEVSRRRDCCGERGAGAAAVSRRLDGEAAGNVAVSLFAAGDGDRLARGLGDGGWTRCWNTALLLLLTRRSTASSCERRACLCGGGDAATRFLRLERSALCRLLTLPSDETVWSVGRADADAVVVAVARRDDGCWRLLVRLLSLAPSSEVCGGKTNKSEESKKKKKW
jgi:hypothetical protein